MFKIVVAKHSCNLFLLFSVTDGSDVKVFALVRNSKEFQILSLPFHQVNVSMSPRSNSPAPSDSISQVNMPYRGDSSSTRASGSINLNGSFKTVSQSLFEN